MGIIRKLVLDFYADMLYNLNSIKEQVFCKGINIKK